VRNLILYFPQYGQGSFLGFLPRFAIGLTSCDRHRHNEVAKILRPPFCGGIDPDFYGSVLPGGLRDISLHLHFSLHSIPSFLALLFVCCYD